MAWKSEANQEWTGDCSEMVDKTMNNRSLLPDRVFSSCIDVLPPEFLDPLDSSASSRVIPSHQSAYLKKTSYKPMGSTSGSAGFEQFINKSHKASAVKIPTSLYILKMPDSF